MKNVIVTVIISVFIYSLIRYFFKGSKKRVVHPRYININELGPVIELLFENKLEFDFFGITSNGIDCVYFMLEDSVINIDFEVMSEEQIKYVDKYKVYAKSKGYELNETTYGNKPNYSGLKDAPVYKILINADKTLAERVGKEIQNEVFGNDLNTDFEIVP